MRYAMDTRRSVSRLHLLLGLVLFAGGFLVSWQLRTEYTIRQTLRISSQRLDELAFLLQAQAQHRERLEAEIATLRRQLEAYADAAGREESLLAVMRRQLDELGALSGLKAVRGPGVVVEIRDSPRPLRPGDDPNLTLVHYTDLQAIVATLWAAGAEAIALNDERLVPTTGLSCVGTTILCNAKRMSPPYVIAAIGNPDRLMAALLSSESPLGMLRAFEFPVRVTRGETVVLPAYRGGFQFRFARPDR